MHPLKTVGINGSVGCGLFVFGFGIVFLLIGLMEGGPLILAMMQERRLEFLFGFVLYLVVGIFAVWGGLGQIILFSRLGKTTAGVSHDLLRPGDTFRFSFTQPFRCKINLQTVKVFLVFRENVSYEGNDGRTTHHFDRLVQSFEQPGGSYSAGQMFSAVYRFQMPARDMGVRHPYSEMKKITLETGWIIKVHLVFAKGWKVWRQYEVSIMENVGEWARQNDPESADPKEPLFDIQLIDMASWSPLRTTNAMQQVLPHLEAGQVGDLAQARPCLLRENLTEQEAQAMKSQLEAAGVTVGITPARLPPTSEGIFP